MYHECSIKIRIRKGGKFCLLRALYVGSQFYNNSTCSPDALIPGFMLHLTGGFRFYSPGCQTGITTVIECVAVRETEVFQHHGGALKPPVTHRTIV